MKGKIHLLQNQIPEVKEPMPLMKLGGPVVASDGFIRELGQTIAKESKFTEGERGARAVYSRERLIAFVDPTTGESNVFPSLETLKPDKGLAKRAKAVAERFASNVDLFPKDGTSLVALAPLTLVASNRPREGKPTKPGEYLSYVRFERRVNGLPVFGPGTRAMIAVANDDSIHALTHRWRSANPTGEHVKPHGRNEISKCILAQLAASARSADVKVNHVTLGYYDGGKKFLQPVYRFHATVTFRDKKLNAAKRHVFGHVSIGAAPEALPVLGAKPKKSPKEPRKSGKPDKPTKSLPPGDPTLGRYVVRNDSQGWVDSANNFLTNLRVAGVLSGFLGRSPIPFTDRQYYWAEPRLFLNEKDSFVNSVQIALTEVHGNWGLFSTRDNADDLVSLSSIPSTGYGGGSGSLAYWIIHSCEVIPTQTDESTSFDVWWNIFKGLHAAVGYRTEMWINDGVTSPFALSIGLGASVVPAWLNAVVSNDSYGVGDATYLDDNFTPKKMEPMGRASAVAVCGHSDDTANDVAPLGAANCLTEWWFNN